MTWQIVRRRRILLEKVRPLLVVVVSEHVEGLVTKGLDALGPGVVITVLSEAHFDLVIAVAVGATQCHCGVSVGG